MRFVYLIIGIIICASALSADAQVQWGRDLEDRKTFSIGFSVGSVFGLDGEVQETTRPIEEIGGRTYGAPPEDYSWDELGFDKNFTSFGILFEKMWTYITLKGHATYGRPEVSSTADRDYYIGVGEVRHEGRKYDYMVIPEGDRFSGEIEAYALDLRMLITPVSFGSAHSVQFTPWLHLGLFAFAANYEVDAGPSQGVTQYENPPRDYVVGGKGSGLTGLLIPEFGLGGELYIPITDRVRLSLQGHAAILQYDGSTRDFGISSRNEKAVKVDYRTFGARALMEIELNEDVDLIAGLEFQYWTGDAEVRAVDRPREEILAMREKFDKDVTFEMTSLMAILGLRF